MNKQRSYTLLSLMFFLAAFFLLLLSAPLWAGDNNNTDSDVNVDVGGDTINVGGDTISVGGTELVTGGVSNSSRAYGFSHGMGDVDINDCLASKQWSTILVSNQSVAPNLWCMAESYDARGLYRMAAFMRCDIEIVRNHFTSDQDCWDANTITPPADPLPAAADNSADEDEERYHAEQISRYEQLNDELEQLRASINKPAPRPVQRTVVEQKPFLTAEQRAALEELKQ